MEIKLTARMVFRVEDAPELFDQYSPLGLLISGVENIDKELTDPSSFNQRYEITIRRIPV